MSSQIPKPKFCAQRVDKPSAFLEKASTSYSLRGLLDHFVLFASMSTEVLYILQYTRSKRLLSRDNYSTYVAKCFTIYDSIQRESLGPPRT